MCTPVARAILFKYMLAVDVKERQDRLPTMYLLHKLHKRPFKARFIANSSSCTTIEILQLLISCLTAIKAEVISTVRPCMKGQGKHVLVYKNASEVLSKLKDRDRQVCPLMISQP